MDTVLTFLQSHMVLIQVIIATLVGGLAGGVSTKKVTEVAVKVVSLVAQESLDNEAKRAKAVDMLYAALPKLAGVLPRTMAAWIIDATWQGLVKGVITPPSSEG